MFILNLIKNIIIIIFSSFFFGNYPLNFLMFIAKLVLPNHVSLLSIHKKCLVNLFSQNHCLKNKQQFLKILPFFQFLSHSISRGKILTLNKSYNFFIFEKLFPKIFIENFWSQNNFLEKLSFKYFYQKMYPQIIFSKQFCESFMVS